MVFMSMTRHCGVILYLTVLLQCDSYNAALSQSISDIQNCPDQKHMNEFRDVVLNAFALTPKPRATCRDDVAAGRPVQIAFIRRRNYKRRPGHAGDLENRLGNEDEISGQLHAWADKRGGVRVAHLCWIASL